MCSDLSHTLMLTLKEGKRKEERFHDHESWPTNVPTKTRQLGVRKRCLSV